jgi:hypothetical protein
MEKNDVFVDLRKFKSAKHWVRKRQIRLLQKMSPQANP